MNPNPVWEKDRTYSMSGPISSGKVSSIEYRGVWASKGGTQHLLNEQLTNTPPSQAA
jgi:hypothetical protein